MSGPIVQSVEGRVSRQKDEEQMQIKKEFIIFEEQKGGLTFTVGGP